MLIGFDVFAIILPNALMAQRRNACAAQLERLGELLREAPFAPASDDRPTGGALFLIELVRDTPEGGRLLVCPGDPEARPFEELGLGAAALAALDDDVLRTVCSYATRDFGAGPEISAPIGHWIDVADLEEHHQGGLHVLRAFGEVEFLTREALRLSPTDEIRVGPDVQPQELRPLRLSFDRD